MSDPPFVHTFEPDDDQDEPLRPHFTVENGDHDQEPPE